VPSDLGDIDPSLDTSMAEGIPPSGGFFVAMDASSVKKNNDKVGKHGYQVMQNAPASNNMIRLLT
jgi:hypothetical protein